ncbi:MAG TPA: carboxymuconolactone decarboxylase family protein [Glycomyces sp.]|nr:carboxymuconolactone decarboxylase family protein [Glycomyces sp.]
MSPRLDFFSNPTGAKVVKHIVSATKAAAESGIDAKVTGLVLLRASQINGCGVCTDMHTKDALHDGEDPVRLALVAAWRDATVFTEAERAALALTEEGTRIADAQTGIDETTWETARKHFDDEQLAGLVAVIALINAFNRLNVLVANPAGSYQPGQWT